MFHPHRRHGDHRPGDSLIYRGQLKDGKPEGLGVLMHGDSVIYSGNWHLGKRQGAGTVTDSHGRSVSGKWYADTIVSGVLRDSAGVYTGELNNSLRPNGYGHYRDTLGTYYEGQWNDGERTGFRFSSQHRYFRVGEWKHDVYKGERLNYNAERIYGIDVSKYQHIHGNAFHTIDWNRLRITNLGTLSKKNVSGNVDFKISFVFIKSTEGASMLNPYYNSDYAAARRNGYAVGTYHFFSHRTSGTQQALGTSSATATSAKATCLPSSTRSRCPHRCRRWAAWARCGNASGHGSTS